MTIYLYIKTHKITGLKYLGQTKNNPYRYNGSGTDWKLHLEKYGDEHYTDILMECQSKEELSNWGRYYSKYYNILNAQDDYGNRIWANRIPETGGGGGSHTPETRAKISAAARNPSDETRAKLSEARKGRIITPETRVKLSEAARNLSPDNRAKKSKAARNLSDETRAKMSEARRGRAHSPATRDKIRAAAKNRSRKL